LYLEFGVFEGRSMRGWSSHLTASGAHPIGFDSFEGLPEDWRPGLGTGHFATGQPPDIADPRVRFVVLYHPVHAECCPVGSEQGVALRCHSSCSSASRCSAS
jgi:hypothetical protein